jgi:hypothetical protein
MESERKFPTIGCCGIDCGLCPRFYTTGTSRCPGCGGSNFSTKHPSCGILTCCASKHQQETCGSCPEFPCQKLDKWDISDSFVSHLPSLSNLRVLKNFGLAPFLDQQSIRMKTLTKLLEHFNDSRSKSFFCLVTALLPLPEIKQLNIEMDKLLESDLNQLPKERALQIKKYIDKIADSHNIKIKLRKQIKV